MVTPDPVERFIDKRYESAHISKLKLAPNQHQSIKLWMKRPRGFLVMLGNPGCGKTYSAIAITRELNRMAKEAKPDRVLFYYPQQELYNEFKGLYQNKWTDESLRERLCNAIVLTIDDFGSTRNNEWQVEIMTHIIDNRYNSQRPTIITSNLKFDEIQDAFHGRIRSRLEAKENLVITDWSTDLRKEGL